jgi:hypothetical protein
VTAPWNIAVASGRNTHILPLFPTKSHGRKKTSLPHSGQAGKTNEWKRTGSENNSRTGKGMPLRFSMTKENRSVLRHGNGRGMLCKQM